MTKIALKGDALGSGSVTLAAPSTDDDIELELPLTGTHLASAQADGMPLGPGGDPVVESGSNSDGEWVRWADGTQQCCAAQVDVVSLEINMPFYGGFRSGGQSAPFPMTFTDPPSGFADGYTNQGGLTAFGVLGGASRNNWAFVFTSIDTAGAATRSVTLFATGRWK